MYAPSDFKNEEHFLETAKPELDRLEFASPSANGVSGVTATTAEDWISTRTDIYKQNHGFFIAHVLEPSRSEGQEYDIFIYLIRHKSKEYGDVEKAEFFFGQYWHNKVYVGSKVGDLIGVKTTAYGPFLALCRVTLKDGSSVMLSKYIDFEMGLAVKKFLEAK
ncbi:MAG: hypothetical protein HYS20_09155 [Rhodocyclales bacterium]|nr:hypothetical protein [Rhodocyclales bacterium]